MLQQPERIRGDFFDSARDSKHRWLVRCYPRYGVGMNSIGGMLPPYTNCPGNPCTTVIGASEPNDRCPKGVYPNCVITA